VLEDSLAHVFRARTKKPRSLFCCSVVNESMAASAGAGDSSESWEQDDFFTGKTPTCGFVGYLVVTFLATGSCSVLCIVLWSTMGFGKESIDFLQDNYYLSTGFGFLSFISVFVLYLFDFFMPPQLPGMLFRLTINDRFFGRGILCLAFVFFVVACFFMAKAYPNVPMLCTLLLLPVSVVLVRVALRPVEATRDASAIILRGDLAIKMKLLKNITGQEQDSAKFYKATALSFLLCFCISLIVWLVWVLAGENYLDGINDPGLEPMERDMVFNQWAVPGIVAVVNSFYASFAALRLFMQRSYSSTNQYRNQLIADGMRFSITNDIMEHHHSALQQARLSVAPGPPQIDEAALAEKRQQYLDSEAKHIKQISLIVKIVGVAFILLLGLLYVAGQLLYADSTIASMVLGLLGVLFLSFGVFVTMSFHRVINAMGMWMKDLPVWTTVWSVARSDWVRAFAFCVLAPWIPGILLLSMLTQSIRKCRGMYKKWPFVATNDEERNPTASHLIAPEKGHNPADAPNPGTLRLTPRVSYYYNKALSIDYVSFFTKCYVLCLLYFCYTLCPPLLNVTLSWMNKALEDLNFGLVVLATFIIGVVAFLLPPVPGMTVYIFGGLVISSTCPYGFWAGSIINIFVGWFLKLVACAIQQKFIGELLGKMRFIRQLVGVHTTAVRCIEAVLREPGMSVGKCAILCGGPDWPTSVTAGVLKLSLVQCEIGTIPIILFVAPCALTGSFYLKRGTSDVWTRAANMMIIFSVVVNMLLWALAAWAIQSKLEKEHKTLKTPLAENVDLHWLDYKADEIKKVRNSMIGFSDVPWLVKGSFLGGALGQIAVCQGFQFGYNYLFGDFQVSHPIDTLVFYGEDGLFTLPAVLAIGIYCGCWVGYYIFGFWASSKTSKKRMQRNEELDAEEASWKDKFLDSLKESEEEVLQAEKDTEEQDPELDPVSTPGPVEPEESQILEPPSEAEAGEPMQRRGVTVGVSDVPDLQASVQENVVVGEPTRNPGLFTFCCIHDAGKQVN